MPRARARVEPGFHKSMQVLSSTKEGGASAEDVMTLINLVRMTVRDHSGRANLEPEVRYHRREKAAELNRRGREALAKGEQGKPQFRKPELRNERDRR